MPLSPDTFESKHIYKKPALEIKTRASISNTIKSILFTNQDFALIQFLQLYTNQCHL
jgi:hypothetical protein